MATTMAGNGVITMPSVGNQTIWLPVSDTATDGTPINPTTGGVAVSFTGGGDPTVWTNVGWSNDTIVTGDSTYYLVEVQLGSSLPLTLAKGSYFIWLKLLFVSPNPIIRHSVMYLY